MLRRQRPRVAALSDLCGGAAQYVTGRHIGNLGGRKTPMGFSRPLGKAPQVKQGPAMVLPHRVPGTTKVRYTNAKGRTFSFSIPVGQLTHPPTVRQAPAQRPWKEIDTSFCDTGDLDSDMPSAVDDLLGRLSNSSSAAAARVADGEEEEEGEGRLVSVNEDELRELQRAFVDLCKEYLLMDTQGMKTSLSYNEINNGPDYEMYDRKLMRKRFWLSIRHRYEDVKELFWPSSYLQRSEAMQSNPAGDGPSLTSEEMLEAIIWLEAASTFCIRSQRAYDGGDSRDFLPIDLTREVRVLARAAPALLASHDQNAVSTSSPTQGRHASDRFISCAALCVKYGVPFEHFLLSEAAATEDARTHNGTTEGGRCVRSILRSLPSLAVPKDAIRMMSVLQTAADSMGGKALSFSDPATGTVTDPAMLQGLHHLCGSHIFGESEAMENVAESELCAVMRFVVLVREQNTSFWQASLPKGGAARLARDAIDGVTQLALTRCRYLLYRAGGPQTTVMSGDEQRVPLVELQQNSERTHPQALVHYRIGMQNASGLRFARLSAKPSAELVALLDRLEATGEAASVQPMMEDLVQHIAHKASASQAKLTLQDAVLVLPQLAKLMAPEGPNTDGASQQKLRKRYDRLLSALSTAAGVELQRSKPSPSQVAKLLEGFAGCAYVPSTLRQMEMVLLRFSMLRETPLDCMSRCLTALAQLVGPRQVSASLLQSSAAMVVEATTHGQAESNEQALAEVLELARTLYHCHYGPFSSMVQTLVDNDVITTDANTGSVLAAAESAVLLTCAAASLPEDSPQCATLGRAAKTHLDRLFEVLLVSPGAVMELPRDLLIDLLPACAALGVQPSTSFLQAVESRATADGRTPLHSLCTPLSAASLLETLERLQFTKSVLYEGTAAYLVRVLQRLSAASESTEAVMPDDVEAALRVAYFERAPTTLARQAEEVLSREVTRLDDVLSGRDDAMGAHETNAASFERRSLQVNESAALAEESLLRYCAAIQHLQQQQQQQAGTA